MIPNHYSATLSDLDMQIVESVPPGGNWKNIPTSIPSKRLEQIRTSYAQGGGSRSTYYGRLDPNAPSYTISTYFNRPGNGCNIHYDFDNGQHRLISQREGARLQSFPDSFVFHGNRSNIYKQIGNAVPPLLAYQIAQSLKIKGQFVDLFCGAGGLALGFKWAGWGHIVGNDIEPSFGETYRANIGSNFILGDICEKEIFRKIVTAAQSRANTENDGPVIVLGGPPCQGFSTAGNKRTMKDARNHLFKQYAAVLEEIQPELFIFENVPGLLNMEKGAVFKEITGTLADAGYEIQDYKLKCEEYGIPQRRTRVILYGRLPSAEKISPPPRITTYSNQIKLYDNLPRIIGVKAALDDLPPLSPGQDGSNLSYLSTPKNDYQRYCRGLIRPDEYIRNLSLKEG